MTTMVDQSQLNMVVRELWVAETTDLLVRRHGPSDISLIRACVVWAMHWRDDFTDLFIDRDDLTLELLHRFSVQSRRSSLLRNTDVPQEEINGNIIAPLHATWMAVQAFLIGYGEGMGFAEQILNFYRSI